MVCLLLTPCVENDWCRLIVAGDETWIVGGGAYHASDKVVQHNGCGTVNVSASLLLKNHMELTCLFKIINFYVEGLHS